MINILYEGNIIASWWDGKYTITSAVACDCFLTKNL